MNTRAVREGGVELLDAEEAVVPDYKVTARPVVVDKHAEIALVVGARPLGLPTTPHHSRQRGVKKKQN